MVMQTYPTTPKEYIIGANSYDFANVGGTNGKDEVKITWLNKDEEIIDLDSPRLSLTDITTLTANAGTNIPVTVTLTDGAGNNIKDKANKDVTTTFLIDVGDGLIGSTITGDMTKKAYNVGDTIDLSGLTFHEQYGSTPTGNPGTEVTYPNSKITVKDKATGTAFTTDLPETVFDATTHTVARTVVITFTPDTSDPTFTKQIEKTVTIYNQVTGVTKVTNPKANYSLNEAMGTVEVAVQRAAKKADGSASGADTKALSPNDFTPAFSTGTPGNHTISYTYVDSGYIGADGTVSSNSHPALTYNYTVADAITNVSMVNEMAELDKKYNHTETPDFSKLEIYTKFASDTDVTSKGNRVQFADAMANGQITVKATFKASEGAVDVTNDLSKITKLAEDLFDNTTHWATVPVTVTFKATPDGGEGVNNKAEANFDIKVYDVIDKIEINAPLGDDPKRYIIGETVIYPVGTYKVIRKSGQVDPTEPQITKEMLDALSQSINTSTAITTPVTVTVTHKERDAHGTEIGYPDTFKYTVADVITKIDVKTPAPTVTAKLGKPLTEDDLAGLYINIYKGDPNTPVGDPVKVTKDMVKGLDTSTLGTKNVRIEYGQDADGNPVSTPFTIEVVDWIENIKVTAPTDDEYEVGENMDLTGGKIEFVWKSGKTQGEKAFGETGVTVNGGSLAVGTNPGTISVPVTYIGTEGTFSGTFDITVNAVTRTPEFVAPTNATTFKFGNPDHDELDLTGGKIRFKNKSGAYVDSEEIDLTVSNSRVTFGTPVYNAVATNQKVDVMLDNVKIGEITYNVEDYIKGITVQKPTLSEYEPGETIDLTGGYVKFTYASGDTSDQRTIALGDSRVSVNGENLVVGNTLGKVDVPVTYTGVEGTFTGKFEITVKDETRQMTLTPPAGDNTFKYGNPDNKTINKTGGKIVVTNKAGATIEEIDLTVPNSRVTFGEPDFTDLGTQNIDVMLDGAVVGQIPITVQDYVMDIILTPPTGNDLVYEVDKTNTTSLKLSGATLQVIKASEAGGTLTTPIVNLADEVAAGRATLGTYDLSTKGPQSISVTWEGKTKSFGITVNDSILSISMHNPPKETQTYGEAIVLTGADGNPAQIAVTRSSGTTYENITSTMVPGYNANQLGPQTVTVTYQGKNTTFNVDVKDKITGIKITKPTKLEYEVGETPDFSTGTVEFVYAGGTKDTNPVSLTDTTKVTITGGSTEAVRKPTSISNLRWIYRTLQHKSCRRSKRNNSNTSDRYKSKLWRSN